MGTEIFIFLGMFSMTAFVAYLFFNTRNKERMSLIESGKDAGLFKGEPDPQYMGALKWGLLLVSIGIGAGVGIYLDVTSHHDGPLFTFPFVLGFGGLGLITYYFIAKSRVDE